MQRQRFGKQIQYTVQLDENLLKLQIPKMILQPLDENYFKHGFDVRTEAGTIAISGECSSETGWLRLEVSDNGKGIGEVERNALQEKLTYTRAAWGSGESGIGLTNIFIVVEAMKYINVEQLELWRHEYSVIKARWFKELFGDLLILHSLPSESAFSLCH